jgi:hypothetical protein
MAAQNDGLSAPCLSLVRSPGSELMTWHTEMVQYLKFITIRIGE